MKVEEYKRRLKLKLTHDIDDVLDELTEKVDKDSLKFNDLIQQKGRLNQIKKDNINGIVAYETSTIEFNKIRFSVAEIISSLYEVDLLNTNKIDDETDELESLFQEAERLNEKEKFEKEKRNILESNAGLYFANREFDKLYQLSKVVQEKYKNRTGYFFNSRINKENNKFIVYGQDGFSVCFTWHQPFFNLLHKSNLFVRTYNYQPPLDREDVRFQEDWWKCHESEDLIFDFSEGWVKGWKNNKTNKFYETENLIEEKFKTLLKLIIDNKKKK